MLLTKEISPLGKKRSGAGSNRRGGAGSLARSVGDRSIVEETGCLGSPRGG